MPKFYAERKYEPLRAYLAAQPGPELTLTFLEVEAIIGARLPRSARARAWWMESAAGPQTRAWRAAGWAVAQVAPRPAPGLVTFARRGPPAALTDGAQPAGISLLEPTRSS